MKISKKKLLVIDYKKVGIIFLIISALLFQIAAFYKISVITTIHEYTIGLVFGKLNPFFYFFVITFSILYFVNLKRGTLKLYSMKKKYWLFVFALIFFLATILIQINRTIYDIPIKAGSANNAVWKQWFTQFTKNNDPAFPTNSFTGLTGILMFYFISLMTTRIGALIISFLCLLSFFIVSIIIWIKSSKRKRKKIIQIKKGKSKEKTNQYLEDISEKEKNDNETKIQEKIIIPFNDPFKNSD